MGSCLMCCWSGRDGKSRVGILEQRTTPLASGHTVEPFVGEVADKHREQWKGYSRGMVRFQPGGMLMPTIFPKFHDRIMKYKFRPKDVVVMTYPKCGTTWMQELVWTMRNNPNIDNPMKDAPVTIRCPFLELDTILDTDNMAKPGPDHPLMQAFQQMCPGANPADGVFVQMAEHIPDPRTIKTHLPFSMLPEDMLDNAKVVYVLRNPKDLVVSNLHHCRLMMNQDYRGTLEEFVDEFVRGDLLFGQYDLHLKEVMARKNNKNVFIIHFEDLKAEPIKEIKRLDQFLNTGLNDEQIDKVAHYTSFPEMKKRDNLAGPSDEEGGMFNVQFVKKEGGFFRKGETGSWKEKLNPELEAKIDQWTKEKLGDTDIKFTYSAK